MSRKIFGKRVYFINHGGIFVMFYGNESLQATLSKMIHHNRLPQGILLYGENGLGKKTLAKQLAKTLLCEDKMNSPCGQCKSCRMLEKGTHPDVIDVEHTGKRGGISVETARRVCVDMATPPNEGKAKCYFFFDCNFLDERTQNTLLKAIEEPPYYVYFFFTAESPEVFLSTIRSRTVAFGLMPIDEMTSRTALIGMGYPDEDVAEAVDAFHGNLGNCQFFLENSQIRDTIVLTKSTICSIIERDEYTFLQNMATLATKKEMLPLFLTQFDKIIRDAATLKYDPEAIIIGCDRDGAKQLSRQITTHATEEMHRAVVQSWKAIDANVNINMILSSLCANCIAAL